MSNYEHIFESAIDCIKSGEDFDDFKAKTAVQDNIEDEFYFIDGYMDRMGAKSVLLDSIWCIASYVYSVYITTITDEDEEKKWKHQKLK